MLFLDSIEQQLLRVKKEKMINKKERILVKYSIYIIVFWVLVFAAKPVNAQSNTLDAVGLTSSSPAATAFSMRKLSSAYVGSALNVLRSSDNTTQNIGFTANGDLDTVALKTFVGSGNGYVTKWYDQSGNGNNLTQSTQAYQPRIVSAGVIDRENGKPFIRFYGIVVGIPNGLYLNSAFTTLGLAIVVNKFALGGDGFVLASSNNFNYSSGPPSKLFNASTSASLMGGSVWQNGVLVATASAVWNNTLMINSIEPLTPSNGAAWDNIGADRTNLHVTTGGGGYTELITFNIALSNTNKSSVESNQLIYYAAPIIPVVCTPTVSTTTASICSGSSYSFNGTSYTVGGTYTAHLTNATGCDSAATLNLFVSSASLDIVGLGCAVRAATAFSMRKLSSIYTGSAINVIRSSDNSTQDIGFTTNGDLDTATLKIFVGAGNGFVTKWYDQSGNGNNLTQATSAYQPRIVNAGAIDRENGKPFIRFFGITGGTKNSLDLAAPITTTGLAIMENKFILGGDGFVLGYYQSYNYNTNPPYLFSSIYASTSIKGASVWQNGVSVVATSAVWNTSGLMVNSIEPLTPNSGTTWDNIGSDRTNGHNTSLGGGYAELMTFSAAPSNADRSKMETNELAYYVATSTITWTGAISTDWSVASNWSGGVVPSASVYVVIPTAASKQPVLSANISVNSIEIDGSLSINGHSLTLNGAVTGTGTLKGSATSSLVVAGAAGTITFDPIANSLQNLTITSGSATLGNALNVIGTLTSTSGTLTTGGYLTLKSTSITNSAVVAPVTGTISGNVTVERYIPAGYRGYRDITPQVYGAGTLYKDWQENGAVASGYGLFITGSTAYASSSNAGATDANGFDKSKTVSANTQDYNYANGGWVALSNTNATNLDAFQGYRLLIRGDRAFNLYTTSIMSYPAGTLMVGATTLRATGNLVYGTVTYSKTGVAVTGGSTASSSYQLNSNVGANTGFNLIANPYVSPVLWGTGSGSQSATATVYGASNAASVGGINGTYWFLDPTLGSTGFYRAYNALTGSSVYTNLNSTTSSGKVGYQYMQAGQAFFVQNASSSPKVVFLETTKAAVSTKLAVFGEATALSKLYISLAKESDGVYTIVDGAALAFDNDFSNAAYGVQDGLKFNNASDNLSISDKGFSLSIDGRLPATSTDKVALAIGKPSGSNYQLVLDASNYINNGLTPFLYDAYTKTTTTIGLGAITIDFTIDSSVSASNVNRFSILFLPSALPVKSIVASASLRNKVVTISWNTIGESGVSAFDVEKSVDMKKFTTISQVDAKNTATATYNSTDNSLNSTSYYRIKVISTNGSISYSNVAKLTANNSVFATIYPNPLKGKTLNVSMENLAIGKYAVSIYNVLGEKMIDQTFVHEGGSASFALTINKKLLAGVYTVAIRDVASNKVVGKTMLSVLP